MQRVLGGLIVLLVWSGTAFGNTGVFFGSGHTVQLVKSADVQMVSEDVTITPICGASWMSHSIEFRCVFVLKNRSAKPLTIQAGFPLDRSSNGPPQPPTTDADQVLSYHFIARDTEKTYHLRYAAGDAQGKFEHIFLWDMSFAAGETKALNVGYILPMSFAAGTTRKISDPKEIFSSPPYEKPWYTRVEGCCHAFFFYITETGQSWVGPIEKAIFRYRNRVFEDSLRERPECAGGKPEDLPMARQDFDELSLLNDLGIRVDDGFVLGMKLGTVFSEISPEGYRPAYIPEPPPGKPQPQYEPDGIAWKFENYKPREPLCFDYYLTGFPRSVPDCDAWVPQVLGKNPTMATVRELREIVAAFFGVAPKTASARRFVEQQIWYKPQDTLPESKLSARQRAVLARLAAIANRQKDVSDPFPKALARLKEYEPGLRGLLKGHAGEVTAVVFSPDGKCLISASADQTVRFWDVATGEPAATLKGHANAVLALALSRDGKTLASADWDGKIRLWDVPAAKNIATVSERSEHLPMTMALSPDGRLLASVASGSEINLWDVPSAKNVAVLNRNGACVRCVAFSPDGKALAWAGEGKAISLWDLKSSKRTAVLTGHAASVHSLVFDLDGKVLASGGEDKTIRLWDIAGHRNIATLQATMCSFPLTFAPDGKTLAAPNANDTIDLWDVARGKKTAILGRNVQFVESIAISPDGKLLASSGRLFGNSYDTTIKLWDAAGGRKTGN